MLLSNAKLGVLSFYCCVVSFFNGLGLELELVQIGKFNTPWYGLHASYDDNGGRDSDRIFVFGGLYRGYKWKPEVVEWSISENRIVHVHSNDDLNRRPGGTPVRASGPIYYFGGCCGGGELGPVSDEVNVFTSDSDFRLSPVGRLTAPCIGSSVAWDGTQRVFAFGGKEEWPIGGATERIHLLDLESGSIVWNGSLRVPLSSSAAVYTRSSGTIFLFGGEQMIGRIPQPSRSILEYNLDTGAVEVVPAMLPVHMQAPCAVAAGASEEVFVIGGNLFSGANGNFVKFHTRTHSTASLTVKNFDFSLEGAACAYVRVPGGMHRIYIFGGVSYTGPRDEIWYVDLGEGEGPTSTTTDSPSTTESDETQSTQATSSSSSSFIPLSSSSEGSSPSAPSSVETEPTSSMVSTSTDETETVATPSSSSPSPEEGSSSSSTALSSSTEAEPGPDPTTPSSTVTTPALTTPSVSSTSAPKTTTQPTGEFDCSAKDRFGLLFQAYVGETATNACPGANSTGTATWHCVSYGTPSPYDIKFNGSHPNYRNCSSNWIDILEDLVEEGRPLQAAVVRTLLYRIQDAVSNPEDEYGYFGHEIKPLLRVVDGVLGLVENDAELEEVEDLSIRASAVYESLLVSIEPWKELSEAERADTATVFIASCDGVGLRLGARAPSSKYRCIFGEFDEFQAMAGCETLPGNTNSSIGVGTGARRRALTFPERFDQKTDSFIAILSGWTEYFEGGASHVSFTGFGLSAKYVNALLPASKLKSGGPGATTIEAPSRIVNGKLMSFTFEDPGKASGTSVPNPTSGVAASRVRISVQHDMPAWGSEHMQVRRRLHTGDRATAASGSARCVFWDADALVWSSAGCWLVSSDRDATVCECSHLTSFAVIMDLHDYVGKDRAQELLTLVLCPASILCLLCSVAVFGFSRFAVRAGGGHRLLSLHPRHDLTFALCLTLLVANLLILLTLDRHYLHLSDPACTASAIALHYTLLLAFAWMALEGVLLAKLVFLDVFSTGREHARYEKAAAVLVPACVVTVTCGVAWARGEGAMAYGAGAHDGFCWLGGVYLWSFAGVVAPVLLFNASVLVMSIRKSESAQADARAMGSKYSRRQAPGFWIRGALSLTVIMGLTWVFGFLMLVRNAAVANAAAYAFTVANASQGIFIFVLHVASSREVRSWLGVCTPTVAQKTTLTTVSNASSSSGGGGKSTSTAIVWSGRSR